jgi:acyl carrier protein
MKQGSVHAVSSVDDSITERVRDIMSDVLQVDRKAIDDSASRDTIAMWDSANHLTLVLALEEAFSVTFDVSEIESMFSLADIVNVLQDKA